MSSPGTQDLAFVRAKIPPIGGGAIKTVARFVCSQCDAHHDITLTSGDGMNPEKLAAKCRESGWRAHAHGEANRRKHTLCPACQKKARSHDPESELKKAQQRMTTQPAPVAPAISPIRPITQDQRAAIRTLLDTHFDDSVGAYLDGMDDAKIAEKVGVPRISVEIMREAAYGPILVDPETVELRKELDALKTDIATTSKLVRDLEAAVKVLSSRLEKKSRHEGCL